jgi:hypothetical protein
MNKKVTLDAINMAQTAKEELLEEATKLNKFCMILRGALIGAATLGIIFAFKSYSLVMFALFSIGVFGMYSILSYFLDVVLFSKIEERINYLKYIADTMFDSVKSATELFDKEEIK